MWLWLRFPPSEAVDGVQKLKDYARDNLVLKGYGYSQETSDSSVPLVHI